MIAKDGIGKIILNNILGSIGAPKGLLKSPSFFSRIAVPDCPLQEMGTKNGEFLTTHVESFS
jgi:hypothetical protein